MHGWRSLNLELTPLDPDLERNIMRARRAHMEMGTIKGMQMIRSTRSTKMLELGMGSKEELMTCISRCHYGNCSYLLRSVPIRVLCCHRLMQLTMI
jgi:hypothetical protein